MMPWALIDVSWLAHRALYTMQGLSSREFPTGVMYGFFEQLRTVAFHPKVKSNLISLFFDSRQSYRKKLRPEYKAKRQERSPEELAQLAIMHRQLDLLRESLPFMGFRVYQQTGCESDDLLAAAVQGHPILADPYIVLITADGDLYQLISDKVHWFDPARDRYYDMRAFVAEKGLDPCLWSEVKAISGCHSDNVKGIPGIGEASAVLYLAKMMPTSHKKFQLITSEAGNHIIEANRPLVTLPFVKTKPVQLQAPVYKPEAFFTFCQAYQMTSLIEGPRRREWELFFAGEMAGGRQVTRRRGEKHG